MGAAVNMGMIIVEKTPCEPPDVVKATPNDFLIGLLLDYIRMRADSPFEPQAPDADAAYADVRTVSLGEIEDSPADGGPPVFSERVYRYDLYHQMHCRWPPHVALLTP
jgi:hypothetical protein